MKNIFRLLLFSLLFVSCSVQKSVFENGNSSVAFKDFFPIDPTEYSKEVEIVSNNALIKKNIKLLTNEETLSFLNNETVLVYIGQESVQGDFNYLPVTVSAKGGTYKVVMDYMKFATLAEYDDEGSTLLGFSRVGVGLRLTSQITTKEAGINIGDLLSLGIAVKAGKVTGRLAIEVIGIKSKEVTTLLPFPSEINQTTIQNAMQALATIKSKVYDSGTDLYPQIMAIKNEIKPEQKKKSKTIEEVKTIENENKLKIQVGTTKAEKAKKLEFEAFDFLFDKNVEGAIQKLEECNKVYPMFNNVYEIKNLLVKDRQNLTDKNSNKWDEVYKTILEKYTWNLSTEIIKKLNEK
jgi:hypothetical protein